MPDTTDRTTEDLAVIKANLASLNELFTEMTAALAEHGLSDDTFAGMVHDIFRDLTWALGFQFRGAIDHRKAAEVREAIVAGTYGKKANDV